MPKPRNRPGSSAKPQHPVPRWAVRLSATAASPTQPKRALNADLSRPTACFDDPILRQHAYQIHHVGISAFLVALAAWQRGLSVTFHYEVATKSPRFANAAIQGFRGELFSVCDGTKKHFFRRTLGDLTSREVSQLCEDKQATKQRLIAHNINVPAGIMVKRGDVAKARAFMAQHKDRYFVLKPIDGTLGEGVQLHLTEEKVLEQLRTLDDKQWLLEEFILGDFYRVYVVGDRCVNAFQNRWASVVGDGQQTITELVKQKNQTRQHRPLYPDKWVQITQREVDYLAAQGLSDTTIPALGERIYLNDSVFGSHGADRIDVTETLPLEIRQMAVQTVQALKVPNAGLDILVEKRTGRAVVLEANQTAIITGNVFPMEGPSAGNTVAEAIIDHYFPNSIDHPRHIKASFDFMQVCQILQSGTVGEVTLPVLGANWVHRRFSIAATQLNDSTVPAIRRAMFTYGIHAQLIKSDVGDLIVDVVAPESRYQLFLKALNRQ